MGFGPGETLRSNDLLYGMMLPSGNDAAHAIARSLGHQDGNTGREAVATSMKLINERFATWDSLNTNLENPHGRSARPLFDRARRCRVHHVCASIPDVSRKYFDQLLYDEGGYLSATQIDCSAATPELLAARLVTMTIQAIASSKSPTQQRYAMISVTLDGVAPDVWYQDNVILLDYAFDDKGETA